MISSVALRRIFEDCVSSLLEMPCIGVKSKVVCKVSKLGTGFGKELADCIARRAFHIPHRQPTACNLLRNSSEHNVVALRTQPGFWPLIFHGLPVYSCTLIAVNCRAGAPFYAPVFRRVGGDFLSMRTASRCTRVRASFRAAPASPPSSGIRPPSEPSRPESRSRTTWCSGSCHSPPGSDR